MHATLTPALKYEIVELIDNRIREKHVTKEDFTELKNIVRDIAWEQKELTKAQKRTESRIEELTGAQKRTELRVEELTGAQKRTESRVEELAVSQKELAVSQKELTVSQKRTESRVEELAVSQKELSESHKELVQSHKDTQEEIKSLTIALKLTRKDLGGVTATLGFMLENEAYRVLPNILKSKYGIEVKEKFLRRSIKSFGIDNDGEVNIFSRGKDENRDKEVVIIGEAKSQLGKDDVDDLLDTVARLKEIDKEAGRFLLLITHYTKERVIEYAKENGVEVIQSFEW